MSTESNGKFSYKSARIKVTGEILKYNASRGGKVGTFILSQKLDEKFNYFEIKIIDIGVAGCISVGLAPYDYPNDAQPGWRFASVGFHADDGRLFQNPSPVSSQDRQISQPCNVGDRMGCGIRESNEVPNVQPDALFGGPQYFTEVYFTLNGIEIGSTIMEMPDGVNGFHPVVGMHSEGETAQLTVIPGLAPSIDSTLDDFMLVDDAEEEWVKIHDVKVNGQIIEYTGNGSNIHDVGLAQGKHPLSTRRHYFEIEIIEPGTSCYIAIGLIHKNYPLHRHPGWNIGSIAYHADDGKIFLGRGQGIPFGPKCSRGDVMGCGIQFPVDYVTPSSVTSDDDDDDDDDAPEYLDDDDAVRIDGIPDYRLPMPIFNNLVMDEPGLEVDDDLIESGDEEDFLWPQPDKINEPPWMPFDIDIGFDDPVRRVMFPEGRMLHRGRGLRHCFRSQHPAIYGTKEKAMNVKVFFTRNGYMVGHKEVMMPKDGFFPAVGMLSSKEKVKVDLHPLTG